jgi:hypothetical protein
MVSSINLCIAFIISVVKQMVGALEIASLDGCKGLQSLINIPSTHQGVAIYFTRYFTRSKMPINKSKITYIDLFSFFLGEISPNFYLEKKILACTKDF